MGVAITFAQQIMGSEKTAILSHLAQSWAKKGRNVCMLDFDARGGLTKWSRLNRHVNITLREMQGMRTKSAMLGIKDHHDITLIDSPGTLDRGFMDCIKVSDLVVVPCQASAMEMAKIRPILRHCNEQNVLCRVVFNKVTDHSQAVKGSVQLAQLGALSLETYLDNRVGFSTGFLTNDHTSKKHNLSTHDEIEILRSEIEGLVYGDTSYQSTAPAAYR